MLFPTVPILRFSFCLIGLVALSCTLVAQSTDSKPSLDEIRNSIASTQGLERAELQLRFLERNDASIKERNAVATELVEAFHGSEEHRILGLAYLAKGTTQGNKGDLLGGIENLVTAESHALLCADKHPEILFKAKSNRAAFLVGAGKGFEAAKLLQELIQFAKPHGDKLSIGHTYLTLALIAENSGATAKAIELLQNSFEISTKTKQYYVAGAAGQTIVSLLHGEGQYDLAEKWIEKTQPWVDQSENPVIQFGFVTRCEEVRKARGNPELASKNLRKLISTVPASVDPQAIGLAYLALSGAELKLSHFDEAIKAAEQAIARLEAFPRSKYLAEHARLEALFSNQEYDEVVYQISNSIQAAKEFVLPSLRLHELNSRALKMLGRHEEALAELQRSADLEKARLRERSQEQMSFMTAFFDDRERESQLTILNQKQLVSEAISQVAESAIEQQTLLAENATKVRNLVIVFSLSLFAVCVLAVRSFFKNKANQLIARRETEINTVLNQRLALQATALKSAEETRRKLEEAVERKQRDEAIGKLTGGVAHDFNNLLTVILNSNEIIRIQENELAAPVVKLLDASTKAAQSGAEIVKHLLSYARQQPLTPTKITISNWLSSASPLFRQTVGNSISYRENDSSNNACIQIDTAKLTTAIINLISNAKDAVRLKGEIELAIQAIAIDEHHDKVWRDVTPGQYVMFEVRDNGEGIAPEDLQRVCEPFFTTKKARSGTGLGLSSVSGFVRQCMGELRIVSELGRGTTVRFILPQCIAESDAPMAVPQGEILKRKEKILVVEDQDSVRASTIFLLQMMGFEVCEADGAEKAIQLLEQSPPPEIVLSDIKMPGSMDGLGLRDWLNSRHPEIRVVLMSGYSELDKDFGKDFLQKPYSRDSLERVLRPTLVDA